MSDGDEAFTGEYIFSLKKNYKIPHKSAKKCENFDVNNPPPPGTEDDEQLKNVDSYVSPLAVVKRPAPATFEIPEKPIQTTPVQVPDSPTSITTKRSRLFMMPTADGLPEELISLFKPLCCDLCNAKLNSPSTARLHYESKNHVKKINNWLLAWSEKTGEPVAKRPSIQKGPTGPNALHCDVCDLALTSIQHAKQHNMGKKHKNALAGRGKPSGSGYYDANNKWIRTSKIVEEDPTNRFSIGEAFLVKKQNNTETVIVPESVLKSPPPPPPPPPEIFPETEPSESSVDAIGRNSFDISSDDLIEPQIQSPKIQSPQIRSPASIGTCEVAHIQTVKVPAVDPSKYCEICDISVTSEMHMHLHLSGAKHAKKLRQLGEPPYTEAPHTLSQCIMDDMPKVRPNVNATDSGTSSIDFSVFRTPSGQYYCQICDLSVTSEITLSQHFASKRHLKTAKKK